MHINHISLFLEFWILNIYIFFVEKVPTLWKVKLTSGEEFYSTTLWKEKLTSGEEFYSTTQTKLAYNLCRYEKILHFVHYRNICIFFHRYLFKFQLR